MSEPLSKVLGLERKDTESDLGHTYNEGKRAGHNNVLDELDQLSPDVEKLAEIIRKRGFTDLTGKFNCFSYKKIEDRDSIKDLAQEIINSMGKWIKKG